jgi:hypothetical protein
MDPNQSPVNQVFTEQQTQEAPPKETFGHKLSQYFGNLIHTYYQPFLRTVVNSFISTIKLIQNITMQVINQIMSK